MPITTPINSLNINILTKEQYNSASKDENQLYLITNENEIIVNNSLNSDSSTEALSAKMGKQLNQEKANLNSPTFTGTPKAPTAGAGTNTTQIATTAFVSTAINNVLEASKAMTFEGTVGDNSRPSLPSNHQVGDTYVVAKAGTYAGKTCEVGDMILCVTTGSTSTNSHWTIVQTNDGAVSGPSSSVDGHIAIFNGSSGALIKDSNLTIEKSVPSNAKFTDTTYNPVTDSVNGLMTSTQKKKLDGIKIENGTIYINGSSIKPLTSHQDISGKANLSSPTFTGTPKAPTAGTSTNNTQIATTAFVHDVISSSSSGIDIKVQSSQPSGQKTGDFWYKTI